MGSEIYSRLLSTCLNSNTHPRMGDWHMWGGWWIWSMIWIAIAIVVGILVYKDAESRGMNGILWLILVLIPMVGLLFLIIYLVIREEHGKEMKSDSGKSAEKLLDERYARGEIGTDEYREMKEEMKK